MKKMFLIIVSLLFLIFLFVGSPQHLNTRSLMHAWDVGHIIIFIFWTSLLFMLIEKKKNKISYLILVLGIFVFVNFVGILIEFLQSLIGRSADYGDMLKNAVGSLIAIGYNEKFGQTLRKSILIIIRTLVTILLFLVLFPFIKSVADETTALQQFPLLANFESLFETDRWRGYYTISRVDSPAVEGNHSMMVQLTTQRYSGVTLYYFPGNWENYNRLRMNIYNPDPEDLNVIIRIHDELHVLRQQPYKDRFNRKYSIKNGWNTVVIQLTDVRNAPFERKMDLSKIKNMRIFVGKLKKQRIFYIDDVRLEN